MSAAAVTTAHVPTRSNTTRPAVVPPARVAFGLTLGFLTEAWLPPSERGSFLPVMLGLNQGTDQGRESPAAVLVPDAEPVDLGEDHSGLSSPANRG